MTLKRPLKTKRVKDSPQIKLDFTKKPVIQSKLEELELIYKEREKKLNDGWYNFNKS